MGITEGQQTAKDLLTGEQTPFVLKADGALHITLAPSYGRVYKMKMQM